MRLLAAVLSVVIASTTAFAAEEAAKPVVVAATEATAPLHPADAAMIEKAKQLVVQQRYEDALALLDLIEPKTTSATIEIEFLRAQNAELRRDLEAAVPHYRNILADHPELTRVRLELARVLFRLEDDGAARHHFELVLGANPPPAVREKVDQFLTAIHNRRRLKFKFGASLVPDTNINSATDANKTTLFGVPFNLSDDARRSSGVGISLNGGVDYSRPIHEGLNLETGAAANYLDYSGGAFDDLSLSGYLGARYYFGANDIGIAATSFRRWYANDGYSLSLGGRADFGHRFTPQWSGRLRVGGQSVDYDGRTDLDGSVYHFQAEAHYAVDAQSQISFLGGSILEDTDDPAFSNISPFVGFGYQREFPYRITA